MDRISSFNHGRPCAIHEEEYAIIECPSIISDYYYPLSFDLDLMTECDDEYWTNPDPALAFKQPAGIPSKIAFANCFIRLLTILAFTLRTIVGYCLQAVRITIADCPSVHHEQIQAPARVSRCRMETEHRRRDRLRFEQMERQCSSTSCVSRHRVPLKRSC